MIDFSKSDESVNQEVLSIYQKLLLDSKSSVDKRKKEIDDRVRKKAELTEQLETAKLQSTSYSKELSRQKGKYLRVKTLHEKCVFRKNNIEGAINNSVETIRRLKRDLQRDQEKLNITLGMLGTEEDIEVLVNTITAIRTFIDPQYPVTLSPDKLEWVTKPIYIKDMDGRQIPHNFGQYKITLEFFQGESLKSRFLPIDYDGLKLVDGYFHPHVATDGTPCLGNASDMLLKALINFNIVEAVTAVNEHLTSYNTANPYIHLNSWVPSLFYSEKCDCGLVVMDYCNCERCMICNYKVIHDKPQVCVCTSCLRQHMSWSPIAAKNGTGIGGTGYVHNSEINPSCRYSGTFWDCTANYSGNCICDPSGAPPKPTDEDGNVRGNEVL